MRIAVTGGIAEGKSTVMGYLREFGLATASADDFAREVFHQSEVQSAISDLLALPLPLDPASVRNAIATDQALRRRVNAVTHPRILDLLEHSPAAWIEVPLLFETCLQSRFDRIWVVTCGESEQLQRLTNRLGDAAEAKRLIATQLPTSVKVAFADEIVRTIGSDLAVKSLVQQGIERESSK